jgi:hypothetical protein
MAFWVEVSGVLFKRILMFSLFITSLGSVLAQSGKETTAPRQVAGSKRDSALYLLQTAQSESGAFDGPMQAAVLFALGRTYSQFDQKKSVDLLTRAYEVASRLPNSGPDVFALRLEIIRAVVAKAPNVVERSLPGEAVLRDFALQGIVQDYVAKKKLATAVQRYENIESDPQVYTTARELLDAIPRSNQELTNRVFFHAFREYSAQQHDQITAGKPEDLGSLLVRYYDRPPAQVVLDAVDELLRQAKPENAPEHSQMRTSTIAAKTKDSTLTFSSFYEFRLFQLLPILEALDPDRAERLLADAQSTRALLARYPDGQRSIDPSFLGQSSTTNYSIVSLNSSASTVISQLESERGADAIIRQADTSPELALPRAEAAPLDVRIPALLGIARMYLKRQPSTSTEALAAVLASVKDDSTGRQWRAANEAADLYLQMNDNDSAARACSKASKVILTLYKQDSDPDNPNQAMKLFWPSVHAWRDVLDTSSKISTATTFEVLKEIPDREVQVLEEVMVASAWVDVPLWRGMSPMNFHKSQ